MMIIQTRYLGPWALKRCNQKGSVADRSTKRIACEIHEVGRADFVSACPPLPLPWQALQSEGLLTGQVTARQVLLVRAARAVAVQPDVAGADEARQDVLHTRAQPME